MPVNGVFWVIVAMGVTDVLIRTDGLCIIRMHRPFVVYMGIYFINVKILLFDKCY